MENIEELFKSNNHEKILELPSPEFDLQKAVAAICLGDYPKALVFAPKKSFERAYTYYKLKDFKKSLKILRKLEGEAVEILKSQCLYFLGYYHEAHSLLSKYGSLDEIAVNIKAIEALNYLSTRHAVTPSLFSIRDILPITSRISCKFNSPECLVESEFNTAFESILDERDYIQELKRLDEKYKIQNSCFKKQLHNLSGEEVEEMTAKEKEIKLFNLGKIQKIENPVLYQANFMPDENTDYKIFAKYQDEKEKFIAGDSVFEPTTDRLKILKAFVIAQRKPNESRSAKIQRTLKGCKDCIEKEILEALSGQMTEKEFQKKGVELITKLNKI